MISIIYKPKDDPEEQELVVNLLNTYKQSVEERNIPVSLIKVGEEVEVDASVIILLGNDAIKYVWPDSKLSVTKAKNKIFYIEDVPVLVSNHPWVHIMSCFGQAKGENLEAEYNRVFSLALKVVEENFNPVKTAVEVEILRTYSDVAKVIRSFEGKKVISLDFETNQNSKYQSHCSMALPGAKALCVGVAVEPHKAFVIPAQLLDKQVITQLVRDKIWVQSNVKYDYQVAMLKYALEGHNRFEDPMLWSYYLDQSHIGNGLKPQCMEKLYVEDWTSELDVQMDYIESLQKEYHTKLKAELKKFTKENHSSLYFANDNHRKLAMKIIAVDFEDCMMKPEFQEWIHSQIQNNFEYFMNVPVCFGHIEPETLYYYNGLDAAYCLQLYNWYLENNIPRPTAYNTMLSAIPALAAIERNGMPVNIKRLNKLQEKIQDNIKENYRNFKQLPELVELAEYMETNTERKFTPGQREMNYMSTDFLGLLAERLGNKIIKYTDKGKPAFDKNVIKLYAQDPDDPTPIVLPEGVFRACDVNTKESALAWSYIKSMKDEHNLNSKFLEKFKWHYNDKTAAIHTDFILAKVEKESLNVFTDEAGKTSGTVTGRITCEPNVQNLNKTPVFQSVFEAPLGWVFVNFDYPQIELRMITHVCKCKLMDTAFKYGFNLHTITACRCYPDIIPRANDILENVQWLMDGNYDTRPDAVIAKTNEMLNDAKNALKDYKKQTGLDKYRDAKSGNFGNSYEQTPAGFAQAFETTIEQAEMIQRVYNESYPEWIEMRKKIHQEIRRTGWLNVPAFNLKRQFRATDNASLRQGPNFYIQGPSAFITLAQLAQIHKAFEQGRLDHAEVKLVNTVHDSVWTLMRDNENREKNTRIIADIMSDRANLPFKMSIPIDIKEYDIGTRLDKLTEVEL